MARIERSDAPTVRPPRAPVMTLSLYVAGPARAMDEEGRREAARGLLAQCCHRYPTVAQLLSRPRPHPEVT